ncbi:hypothetical protein [Desulfatibacillum aliphaticivorans]|uniref:hypothetical protein n=1 Tax=Desulfatibacillum aliphaticivorans TaxID=218208 RepID=UPI0004180C60|nr:hypothetical protein [Desulfatibacillum aliphaticivorans]
MKRLGVVAGVFFILALFAGAAFAGMVSEFQLTDGTVLRGEIIAHSGRVYSIRSKTLGVIRVHESKITSISSQNPSSGGVAGSSQTSSYTGSTSSTYGASSSGGDAQVVKQSQALQRQMMSNPNIMNEIMSLSSDPEIMEILADPEIMNAVSSGDINTLMANPKFMKLLSHPKMQQITKMTTSQ